MLYELLLVILVLNGVSGECLVISTLYSDISCTQPIPNSTVIYPNNACVNGIKDSNSTNSFHLSEIYFTNNCDGKPYYTAWTPTNFCFRGISAYIYDKTVGCADFVAPSLPPLPPPSSPPSNSSITVVPSSSPSPSGSPSPSSPFWVVLYFFTDPDCRILSARNSAGGANPLYFDSEHDLMVPNLGDYSRCIQATPLGDSALVSQCTQTSINLAAFPTNYCEGYTIQKFTLNTNTCTYQPAVGFYLYTNQTGCPMAVNPNATRLDSSVIISFYDDPSCSTLSGFVNPVHNFNNVGYGKVGCSPVSLGTSISIISCVNSIIYGQLFFESFCAGPSQPWTFPAQACLMLENGFYFKAQAKNCPEAPFPVYPPLGSASAPQYSIIATYYKDPLCVYESSMNPVFGPNPVTYVGRGSSIAYPSACTYFGYSTSMQIDRCIQNNNMNNDVTQDITVSWYPNANCSSFYQDFQWPFQNLGPTSQSIQSNVCFNSSNGLYVKYRAFGCDSIQSSQFPTAFLILSILIGLALVLVISFVLMKRKKMSFAAKTGGNKSLFRMNVEQKWKQTLRVDIFKEIFMAALDILGFITNLIAYVQILQNVDNFFSSWFATSFSAAFLSWCICAVLSTTERFAQVLDMKREVDKGVVIKYSDNDMMDPTLISLCNQNAVKVPSLLLLSSTSPYVRLNYLNRQLGGIKLTLISLIFQSIPFFVWNLIFLCYLNEMFTSHPFSLISIILGSIIIGVKGQRLFNWIQVRTDRNEIYFEISEIESEQSNFELQRSASLSPSIGRMGITTEEILSRKRQSTLTPGSPKASQSPRSLSIHPPNPSNQTFPFPSSPSYSSQPHRHSSLSQLNIMTASKQTALFISSIQNNNNSNNNNNQVPLQENPLQLELASYHNNIIPESDLSAQVNN